MNSQPFEAKVAKVREVIDKEEDSDVDEKTWKVSLESEDPEIDRVKIKTNSDLFKTGDKIRVEKIAEQSSIEEH